tara:strand:- start:218 stop:850 length:633 start_codon:yes stop_codon:yes gene_type:complete
MRSRNLGSNRKLFMSFFKSIIFIAFLFFLPQTYVQAQSVETQQPALSVDGLSTEVITKSQSYLDTYYDKETFGRWTLRCVKTSRPIDPCQLFQLMYNLDGTPVAEFNLNVIETNGAVVVAATVITPLETLLTAQLTIQVDGKNSKVYPFVFCLKIGCVARVGLTEADLDSYRTGNQATVTMVPAGAPKQYENLILSLDGFKAGQKALMRN